MKHFFGFISAVVLVLLLLYFYKDDGLNKNDSSSLKVYGSESFIGSWGPGPQIKELFEKQYGLKVTYIEMNDPLLLLQKMSFDGPQASGDVILSLDQFDIVRSTDKIKWKPLKKSQSLTLPDNLKLADQNEFFSPYDWSAIAIVTKKSSSLKITNLDDLLNPEIKNQIAYLDPRTSSPGLHFLNWIFKVKGSDQGRIYLEQLMNQAYSFSPSWSSGYGLFKNGQVQGAVSYVTSPIYHEVEDKDNNYTALELSEGHPVQVEFAGIPETCTNCDSAQRFVEFIQSDEIQKIIMEKNYMFPVKMSVIEGTPFDKIKKIKLLPFEFEDKNNLQQRLSLWSELRQVEN